MGFTMDMLDLEKLLEHAEMVEKISEGVVDTQGYNTVTKSINESVFQNTDADIDKVMSNGDKLNDKLDLDLLESQVNGALGLTGSKIDPVNKEDTDVNNDGKVNESDEYLKNRRETIAKEMDKENVMENATDLANIPHDAGKPAVGVDSAEKFQQAVAVKQSEFVNANTEHVVSETADSAEVDGNADKAMDAMRDGATVEKNAGLGDGGQNIPTEVISPSQVVTESSDDNTVQGVDEDTEGKDKMQDDAHNMIADSEVGKSNDEWKKGAMAFKTFVESLKDGQNDRSLNAVIEAFEIISVKR